MEISIHQDHWLNENDIRYIKQLFYSFLYCNIYKWALPIFSCNVVWLSDRVIHGCHHKIFHFLFCISYNHSHTSIFDQFRVSYIYVYLSMIYMYYMLHNLTWIRIKIYLPYLRQPVYTSYLLSMFKHLPLCEHRRLVVRDDGFLLKNTIRKKRGFKSTWTSRGHSSRICVYVYKCRFHILQSCY